MYHYILSPEIKYIYLIQYYYFNYKLYSKRSNYVPFEINSQYKPIYNIGYIKVDFIFNHIVLSNFLLYN